MRLLTAVLIGAIIATITLLIVGLINNAINPTPPELMDPATPEAVTKRVEATSIGTWIATIFGTALGGFLGGVVGGIIAMEKTILASSVVGLVHSIWAYYTFYVVYPAVLWVPFSMLISAVLCSWLGGVMVMYLRDAKN